MHEHRTLWKCTCKGKVLCLAVGAVAVHLIWVVGTVYWFTKRPLPEDIIDMAQEPQFWLVSAMCVTYVSLLCIYVWCLEVYHSPSTVPGLPIRSQVGLGGFEEPVMKYTTVEKALNQQVGVNSTWYYIIGRAGRNTAFLHWSLWAKAFNYIFSSFSILLLHLYFILLKLSGGHNNSEIMLVS